MAKQTTWLWPDHAISKAESRTLREEHNALANQHAELLAACKSVVDYYQNMSGNPSCPVADKYWIDGALLARAAIAKIQ